MDLLASVKGSLDENKQLKVDVIDNLHKFLDTDEDHGDETSIQERTKAAIVLLQCLPCARSAVLEQVGEVFHEVAKKYVIEVEKQMLSGEPGLPEVHMHDLDDLVRSIERILTGFIQCNHIAWASQIARWSVSLIGELCSQYGVLRAFSTLPIDERLQLWMNCEACRLLVEISVFCFSKIIEDTPDVCVEYLLDTAAQSSPFFDWAIAHMCCCFLDVVPYGILSHALLAFSLQAKNAETIINCVTRVYNYLLDQHGKVLQTAVLDLFKDSITASTVEIGSEQEHIDKCTLPFLLHLALQVPRLVDQISGKIIDLLDTKTITALNEQASKRDSILQRGLISRVLDILKNITNGTFKILMFLIDKACTETTSNDEATNLQAETKRISSTLLQMLLLSLNEDVNLSQCSNQSMNEDMSITQHQEEASIGSAFLKSLQKHVQEICQELLNSSGMRAKILVRIFSLVALQGGDNIAIDAMVYLLVNSKSQKDLINVITIQHELEVYKQEGILEKTLHTFCEKLCSKDSMLPSTKVFEALNNCIILLEDDAVLTREKRTKLEDILKYKWCMISRLVCNVDQSVSFQCMKLLDLLALPTQQPLSDVFRACLNLVTSYFNCLQEVMKDKQVEEDVNLEMVMMCDKLLLSVVKRHNSIQQAVLRMIVEALFEKENAGLISSNLLQEDDDESLIKEPKVQLLDKNNSPAIISRIPINSSSVIYAGSLNRNKRKIEIQIDLQIIMKTQLLQQCLLNTLHSILSSTANRDEKMEVDRSRDHTFTEIQLSRLTDVGDKTSYCFLASLMAEIICPDVIATLPWPDEEFLKYTMERDIKIKKQFEASPFLWEILSLISNERPALCHCIVIVQSLFASCLTFWEVDRKTSALSSPSELKQTLKMLQLIKQAGWVPEPWCNVGEILEYLKPHEVYMLLSGIWCFCRETNLSPTRYTEKDYLGTPAISFTQDQIDNLFQLYRKIFLSNMASLGVFFKRYFQPGKST